MAQVDPSVLSMIRGNGAGGRLSQSLVSLQHFYKQDREQGEQILRAYVDGAWGHGAPAESHLKALYEAALRFDRKNAYLHYCWGFDLSMLGARTNVIDDRNRLMREANERFSRAVKFDPAMASAWNNWGNNLIVLSRTSPEPEKSTLLTEAFDHYETAVRLEPGRQHTYFNWGKTLCALGEEAEGETRERFMKDAIDKLDACLRIKPDRYEALVLRSQANRLLAANQPPEQREAFLKEALESAGKAAQFAPGDGSAHHQWGKSLLAVADISESPETYLQFAREELEIAAQLLPNDTAIMEDFCTVDDRIRRPGTGG